MGLSFSQAARDQVADQQPDFEETDGFVPNRSLLPLQVRVSRYQHERNFAAKSVSDAPDQQEEDSMGKDPEGPRHREGQAVADHDEASADQGSQRWLSPKYT
jgi:hypothetical protein